MELNIDGWTVLIDDDDYYREFGEGRSWRVSIPKKKPYLEWQTRYGGKRKYVKFHRLITGAKQGQQVDHINGNSLDNRRQNLRIVTALENNRNSIPRQGYTSKYKGVGWNKSGWRSRIRVGYKHIALGVFKDEIEAAFAYDIASLKYHGEFGLRNFLPLA